MDWVVAILLGAIVVGLIFAGSFAMAILSALLVPVLFFAAIVFGIWFLLQVAREERKEREGQDPDP